MQANREIRHAAGANRVFLWQVAEKLNISEYTFSRRLRHELPPAEKQKILNVIDEIAEAQDDEN